MGFVETAFLGALGALAIPIVVHLIFRRRTERVDLGTIRFLRAVLEKHTKRRKVRRWSLLVLRMVAVALLVLAFARPFLVARAAGGGGGRTTVVLVDVSASTTLADDNGRTPIDAAVAEVRELLGGSMENVRLAAFDDEVRPLEDLDALGELTETPTFGGTNFAAAVDWARDVVVSSGASRRVVHVYTDLQRSGLDFASAAALPDDVELHVHDLGRDHVNNVAVTEARPLEPVVRPGETATVVATVHNAGPVALENVPVTLLLEHDGRQRRDRRRVNLPAEGGIDLEFEVADLDEGAWTGHVEVEAANDLAFDDRRHLAIVARPRWHVLVVDGDPGRGALLSESYFVETALRLAPPGATYAGSPFTTTVVDATAEENPFAGLSRADLVVLANVTRVDSAAAERLAGFVAEGKGLVVFTGDNVRPDGYRALAEAGLGVGDIRGVELAAEVPTRIASWRPAHPMLEPFDDPQHGDLRRLSFSAHTRIEPAAEANVLATFDDDTPAVLERDHGRGRVLWWTTAADTEWSDWTASGMYVPLMHQTLRYLAGLAEGGPVREAALGENDLPRAPGVHETNGVWHVVNAGPRESETERCTVDEFVERFGGRTEEESESETATAGVVGPRNVQLRDDEVWHWFVVALMGVLCLESFVANRTAV